MASRYGSVEDAIRDYQRRNPIEGVSDVAGLYDFLKKEGYNVQRPNRGQSGRRGLKTDVLVIDGRGYNLIKNVDNSPGSSRRWLLDELPSNEVARFTYPTALNDSTLDNPNAPVRQPGAPAPDGARKMFSSNPNPARNWPGNPGAGTPKPSTGWTGRLRDAARNAAQRLAEERGLTGPAEGSPGSGSGGTPPTPGGPGEEISSAYRSAVAAAARQRTWATRRGGRQSTIFAGFGAGRPRTSRPMLSGY